MNKKERQLLKEALIPHLPEGWIAEGRSGRGPIKLQVIRYPTPNNDGFIFVQDWIVAHREYDGTMAGKLIKKVDCSNSDNKIEAVIEEVLKILGSLTQ